MTASTNWKAYTLISICLVLGTLIIALATRLWVITAIPIGFLFGFFLQKGDLCGASAFSEVILMKDWRKMWGIWICIVVSMLGFALLDSVGAVTLNVKPMIWLNYIVGGVLFGVGMVLAGGCVSGCLFKAGTGNINSIAALIAIPLGVSMVEYGPLNEMYQSMQSAVVSTQDGKPLGIHLLTGIPYWVLAVLFAAITILVVVSFRKRNRGQKSVSEGSLLKKAMTQPWKPWQAGIAIGILGMVAYLSSAQSGRNYPLGVTHGVLFAQVLVTDRGVKHVYQKTEKRTPVEKDVEGSVSATTLAKATSSKKIVWWLVLLITSLMVGSFVSGKMTGNLTLFPRPPEQTIIALLGGFLVGTGAAFAKGCVIGNIISGWALMSVGTILFGVVVILSNWATTYLYLMGGASGRK